MVFLGDNNIEILVFYGYFTTLCQIIIILFIPKRLVAVDVDCAPDEFYLQG